MKAFKDIRVLDLTHIFAGPFCTFQLAVMGADVIKIETAKKPDHMRREGLTSELNDQQMGSLFISQNSGKRSLTLDLKKKKDKSFFYKLVKTADVVVQNYSGNAMDRLGISFRKLKKINPAIIYCSMTGFGRTGPKAEHPAYDNVIQAYSGLMTANGTLETGPLRVGPAIVDYGTGVHAAFAIAAALFQRSQTGEGQEIDVAMLDAALMLMTSNVGEFLTSNEEPPVNSNTNSSYAGYATFETKIGLLQLGAFTKKQLSSLFKALNLLNTSREVSKMSIEDIKSNCSNLRSLIQTNLLKNSADFWEDKLNKAHVPAARVRSLAEALNSQQVKSRKILQKSKLKKVLSAPKTLPVASFSFRNGSPEITTPAPQLGQHNEEIKAEIV